MHLTDTELIQIKAGRGGRNANSPCEQHHQPARSEPHNQRNPDHVLKTASFECDFEEAQNGKGGLSLLVDACRQRSSFPRKNRNMSPPFAKRSLLRRYTSEERCRLLSCCVRYNACATLPDSVVDYRISMRRAKRAFTSRVADCSYQEPQSATLRFTPLLTEARVNEYARCADRIHRR
jgi:hypothetical protein